MSDILQNKNSATRFQILVEIASKGPAVEQKTIAAQLEITPQAVSEYLKHLIAEKLVVSEGRSRYRLTSGGVNWMLKQLRDLNTYVDMAERAVTDISVNAALALGEIKEGQDVGLIMRDGILMASTGIDAGARGVAAGNAQTGEDVGITGIRGIVPLSQGTVFLAAVPGIKEGGSHRANLERLALLVRNQKHIAALGIEAFASLKRVGVEPRYFYSVPEVVIDAARYGLEIIVVAVSDELPDLIKALSESGIEPHFIDLRPD
jgi:putative transcriptional regulator